MKSSALWALTCLSEAIISNAQKAPPQCHLQGLCQQPEQAVLGGDFEPNDPLLANSKPAWGLTTFANLPHVPCFAKDDSLAYDIAIVGAPFDTVSPLQCSMTSLLPTIPLTNLLLKAVTGRPGARFGPRGIRSGSWRINPLEAWNAYTGSRAVQVAP
jgi:agmatinase